MVFQLFDNSGKLAIRAFGYWGTGWRFAFPVAEQQGFHLGGRNFCWAVQLSSRIDLAAQPELRPPEFGGIQEFDSCATVLFGVTKGLVADW